MLEKGQKKTHSEVWFLFWRLSVNCDCLSFYPASLYIVLEVGALLEYYSWLVTCQRTNFTQPRLRTDEANAALRPCYWAQLMTQSLWLRNTQASELPPHMTVEWDSVQHHWVPRNRSELKSTVNTNSNSCAPWQKKWTKKRWNKDKQPWLITTN